MTQKLKSLELRKIANFIECQPHNLIVVATVSRARELLTVPDGRVAQLSAGGHLRQSRCQEGESLRVRTPACTISYFFPR